MRFVFAFASLLFSSSCLFAQEKPPVEKVPQGFRLFLVADERFPKGDERNRVGKLHDPVCEHGLFTVMGVFARDIPKDETDPLFPLVKRLQLLADKYQAQRLGAFTAFLTLKRDFQEDDMRDENTAAVADFARKVDAKRVSLGFAESGEDPATAKQNTEWKLDKETPITVVVYHRFNIVKRWTFTKEAPPTEKELDELSAQVTEIMKRKS